MKRESLFSYICVFCIIFLFGCATITYDASVPNGFASINNVQEGVEYDVVGQFEYSTRSAFVIASLLTVKDAEMDKAVNRALNKYQADGIVNIKIEEVTNFVDFLIAAVQSALMGTTIFETRHVEITGDAIRLKSGSAWQVPSIDDQIHDAVTAHISDTSK